MDSPAALNSPNERAADALNHVMAPSPDKVGEEQPPAVAALDECARAEVAAWAGEHWESVFALLYRLLGNRHQAEDLTQETFLRAAQRRSSFAAGTNLRAWLMRIATNAFLDGRRRKRVARSEPLEDQGQAAGPDPVRQAHSAELAQALEAAIMELPETARAVFLLRTNEDMSFRQIAQAIASTEETARWHMLQARRRLMERLAGWL